LGLLDALDEALEMRLNLTELRTVAGEFERQVSLAVRDNPEIQQQIAALEARYDAQGPAAAQSTPQELPDSGTIIADIETLLREQRDEG
jgi:hypothetical protein